MGEGSKIANKNRHRIFERYRSPHFCVLDNILRSGYGFCICILFGLIEALKCFYITTRLMAVKI